MVDRHNCYRCRYGHDESLAGSLAIFLWLTAGFILWFFLYKTGIHPVLAGVILAAFLPATGRKNPVSRLGKKIHPWVDGA